MYSAIHVIQQEMDITGTTAREAATTLTGSFAAMKAAAQNVLGNWSTGADLTAPLQALTDTARTYLVGNLLPMIGNVLQGIPQVIYGLVPKWCRPAPSFSALWRRASRKASRIFWRMLCRSCFPLRKTCGKMPGSS